MDNQIDNHEVLLTIDQAARRLNVSKQTLRQWDKKGILKAVRFGIRGDRRYKEQDLLDFMKKQHENQG